MGASQVFWVWWCDFGGRRLDSGWVSGQLQALLWTFGIRRRNGKRPGKEGALLSPTNRDTKTKHSVSAEAFEM